MSSKYDFVFADYANDSSIDLEVQCGTDQEYMNDISSHEVLRKGSSESLFVPMPQNQITANDINPSLPSKKKRKHHKRKRLTTNGNEPGECSENCASLPSSPKEQ